MRKIFQQYLSDIKGSVSLNYMLAFGAVVIAGGSAMDIVRLHSVKQNLQSAADSAALHASLIAQDGDLDLVAESSHIFYKNMEGTSNLAGVTYNAIEKEESVEVKVSVGMKPAFMQYLGYGRLNAKITSEASINTGKARPACITTVGESSGFGFIANSGAGLQAEGCEIHIHSLSSPAAIFNSGIIHDLSRTCIAGGNIIDNNGTIENIETECEVAEDPYVDQFPVPDSSSCDYSHGNYNGGYVDMQPGVYCGWHNFNNGSATVNFAPGLYVIKNGGWNVNGGTWNGDGVTFYYADQSKIQFNSGVSADLRAPSEGDYAGALFTETPGLAPSQIAFNDTQDFSMNGILYLPSRNIIYNSGAHFELRKFELVAASLLINGAVLNLGPSDYGLSEAGSSGVPRLLQ